MPMNEAAAAELRRRAFEIRRDVVSLLGVARADCLATSLSAVDILVWLYGSVLNFNAKDPFCAKRDRFVLSRIDATPALYAVLAERSFFQKDQLWGYRRLGSTLQPFPEHRRTPGIDASCGSWGMGLGVAMGLALALKAAGPRVFCLMGAEEMVWGSVWETLLSLASVPSLKLTLLVNSVLDKDEAQNQNFKSLEMLGCPVAHSDGHDMGAMASALNLLPGDAFGILLLKTVRGKGISSLENDRSQDGRLPDRQAVERFLGELEDGAP